MWRRCCARARCTNCPRPYPFLCWDSCKRPTPSMSWSHQCMVRHVPGIILCFVCDTSSCTGDTQGRFTNEPLPVWTANKRLLADVFFFFECLIPLFFSLSFKPSHLFSPLRYLYEDGDGEHTKWPSLTRQVDDLIKVAAFFFSSKSHSSPPLLRM